VGLFLVVPPGFVREVFYVKSLLAVPLFVNYGNCFNCRRNRSGWSGFDKSTFIQGMHVILLTRSASSAKKKFSEHSLLEYSVWNPAKKVLIKHYFHAYSILSILPGLGLRTNVGVMSRKKEISDSRIIADED
jgi:hypothetical protein